jgi:hypothetical protein
VLEVAEQVIREELLGGTELAVGSAGWGNDQSGLSPVRCLRRKRAARKSRGPASIASAVGRLMV